MRPPIVPIIPVLLFVASLAVPAVGWGAPANDACVDATVVDPGTGLAETLDSATATTDLDDPLQSCTVGGPSQNTHSVWYRFTAPAGGVLSAYTLNTVFPADPPTIVSVHTGGCGALTEIGCYDSETPIASYLHVPVTSGETYWIEISNEAGSAGGAVEVDIYFEPDSPICPDAGGTFLGSTFSLNRLGGPAGDERLKVTARLFLHQPLPWVPGTGFQIMAEDPDAAFAPIVEWSARTLAIPPGALHSGCGPKDGWSESASGSSYKYRNRSNALPPTCAPGSANGLTEIRLLKKSADARIVDVKIRAKNTTSQSTPALDGNPSIRLSMTAEAVIGPSNADRCGFSFLPLACKVNGTGTTLSCKQTY
jgi:hypothetical protein